MFWRKNRFSKSGLSSSARADTVLGERARKRKAVKLVAGLGAVGGLAVGFAAACKQNPHFLEGLGIMAAGTAGGAAIAGASTFAVTSVLVRKATENLGRGLAQEIFEDSGLWDFVHKYRYIIVDKKGNLKGTNVSRGWTLGLGRIRLESRKIISGKY